MLKYILGAVAFVVAIAVISYVTRDTNDASAVKFPKMTPMLSSGKMIYDAKCAECHGVNAVGTEKGPTFLHKFYHPGHHGDQSFYVAVSQGVKTHHWSFGDMPPVEGVTPSHVEKIIFYVRTLQQANGLF